MTIEKTFLLIVLLIAAFLCFAIMRLKKKRYSECFFVVFAILLSMFYLAKLFPITIFVNRAQTWLHSWIPCKNLLDASFLYAVDTNGNKFQILTDKNEIISFLLVDFFLAVFLSAWAFSIWRKRGKAFAMGAGIPILLISIKTILSLRSITGSVFDSVEFAAAILGALLGIFCGHVIRNRKNEQ